MVNGIVVKELVEIRREYTPWVGLSNHGDREGVELLFEAPNAVDSVFLEMVELFELVHEDFGLVLDVNHRLEVTRDYQLLEVNRGLARIKAWMDEGILLIDIALTYLHNLELAEVDLVVLVHHTQELYFTVFIFLYT